MSRTVELYRVVKCTTDLLSRALFDFLISINNVQIPNRANSQLEKGLRI